MTTTLRPAGPEQHGVNGARSRGFTVCVNSRPVGTIELSAGGHFGEDAGRVVSLAIDGPDRRRGRGTVAALAAEEVLRGWGCRRVMAAVPEQAEVARRLAGALGYRERNRSMAKPLGGEPPALPEGSRVRPIREDDYLRWHGRQRRHYIDSWVAVGLSYAQAAAKADADYGRALPDGPHTDGTTLRVLGDDTTDVGWLWVRLRNLDDTSARAWVYSVDVAEEYRGHGHGRTLMLVAERECLAAGVDTLGLNVFTDNSPALRLYASLGYRTTTRHLVKELIQCAVPR